MTIDQLQQRRDRYAQLSTRLAALPSAQLRALWESHPADLGWGATTGATLDTIPLFIKRIPVAQREVQQAFSTANLYDLPLSYHYGFGSAGINVFRELALHSKTTQWVLDGICPTFPLLYHARMLPTHTPPGDYAPATIEDAAARWNHHPQVVHYLQDRAQASHELVLALKYIPHTAISWLADQPAHLPRILTQLENALAVLQRHGIVHFDADFFNVLTDGSQTYLTDFGLALDGQFAIHAHEQQFLQHHRDYDAGMLCWNSGMQLYLDVSSSVGTDTSAARSDLWYSARCAL